jgi:hypothetical protein
MFAFGATPPIAATFFFIGLILTILGFVVGLGFSGFFAYRHANWTSEMRERIAADGIKAEEIDWFRNELKTSEKRMLREMQRTDPLLEDISPNGNTDREVVEERADACETPSDEIEAAQETESRKRGAVWFRDRERP